MKGVKLSASSTLEYSEEFLQKIATDDRPLFIESLINSRPTEETAVTLMKIVRPSFLERKNQTLDDSSEWGEVWKQRLQIKGHKQAIMQCLPSVGRVVNQDIIIGTAWMIHSRIAVTTKHTISAFTHHSQISVIFGGSSQYNVRNAFFHVIHWL